MRERKKQRTRDALVRAALELFTTRGYERTTVDEIVAAVDVSQRTFFRYFAGKEQVVFAVQEMVEARFVEVLRARPPQEPAFEALRRSVLDAWDSIGESIEQYVPVETYMRVFQMIESTPVLLAEHTRRALETQEETVRIVAEREGLDPDTDHRPRVAVAAFSGVMQAAGRQWGAGGDLSVESMRRLTASLLDQLEPALAGDWRA
ncbi:TetR family transcriptional regulator [Streptomyces sp. TRM66268-LWL]|uniref:TetR family transcriptional regulator n=1 Tax=Streptomyces polyasparticus TaxID=2767826 RepID=A0ABR7SAT9_9ACTN|nr:TetR family transcriptional regulator [Streptomyces polyasparticus]